MKEKIIEYKGSYEPGGLGYIFIRLEGEPELRIFKKELSADQFEATMKLLLTNRCYLEDGRYLVVEGSLSLANFSVTRKKKKK
ncbi:MAG: hypothetical protein WC756_18055 [Taibaiella sp.]|jgi:hypothetical protein